MITRENYEIYFIDYLEGQLSGDEISMVEVFIENNKDLKHELDLIISKELKLSRPKKQVVDFSFLKKEEIITQENEDDFFIGRIENDLNQEEEKLLSIYLSENPTGQEKMDSYEKTILPNSTLVYPKKQSLKKSRAIIGYLRVSSGIAAAIVLLFYVSVYQQDIGFQRYSASNKTNLKVPVLDNNQPIAEVDFQKKPIKLNKKKNNFLVDNHSDSTVSEKQQKKVERNQKIEIEMGHKYFESEKREFVAKTSNFEIENNTPIKTATSERKTYTAMEYVKEKVAEFTFNKTGQELKTPKDLLALASGSIKIPKFVELEEKKNNKENVKVFRIGRFITITRKK